MIVGVTILDRVTIGRGSIIGAGMLIAKDVLAELVILAKRNKFIRSKNK